MSVGAGRASADGGDACTRCPGSAAPGWQRRSRLRRERGGGGVGAPAGLWSGFFSAARCRGAAVAGGAHLGPWPSPRRPGSPVDEGGAAQDGPLPVEPGLHPRRGGQRRPRRQQVERRRTERVAHVVGKVCGRGRGRGRSGGGGHEGGQGGARRTAGGGAGRWRRLTAERGPGSGGRPAGLEHQGSHRPVGRVGQAAHGRRVVQGQGRGGLEDGPRQQGLHPRQKQGEGRCRRGGGVRHSVGALLSTSFGARRTRGSSSSRNNALTDSGGVVGRCGIAGDFLQTVPQVRGCGSGGRLGRRGGGATLPGAALSAPPRTACARRGGRGAGGRAAGWLAGGGGGGGGAACVREVLAGGTAATDARAG
jgi:hypothetical protein